MNEVTRILRAIEGGERQAASELLPLVYEELRRLAAQRMGRERAGDSLQATALVHEAYLRLVGGERAGAWDGRGHFFAAAAEAMRRILVERARRRASVKQGGGMRRVDLENLSLASDEESEELLALDEALGELERHDPKSAELVKLRYFAGFTHEEAAEALGISRRAADRLWSVAKAWLYQRIGGE
jgi:RNA polymerase sigma factor (TIGR02999 family)